MKRAVSKQPMKHFSSKVQHGIRTASPVLLLTVEELRANEILLDAALFATQDALVRQIEAKLLLKTKEVTPWLLPSLIITQ